MANNIKFQFDLTTTNQSIPLGLEVFLDGNSMFKTEHVTDPCQVMFDINDDEATHKIQLIMTGKKAEHTKVDDQGNITSDALLKITNVVIDEIILDQFLINKSIYTHDFNGSQDPTAAKFYYAMGCNGTVTWEFTTPFYLWLLENM